MAKKSKEMCAHGCKGFVWSLLIVGILFLLVDFGYWTFWNIKWWTAVFLLLGLHGAFCKCH